MYQNRSYPLRNYSADVTEDEKALLIYGSEGTSGNNLLMIDLTKDSPLPRTLVEDFSADYRVIDKIGSKLIALTNKDASNFKLVMIDIEATEQHVWEKVIPENKHLLEEAILCGGKMMVKYL